MSTSAANNPSQISATKMDILGGIFANADNGNVIINGTVTNGDTEVLKALLLHTAPDALHTSKAVSRQNICTPGTRTVTLSHLHSLATSSDPDSPDVVWMHGPAGAGKSAIMRTLANELAKDSLLLASFFFFRSENQRNTSSPFIPTLAARVCDALPGTQTHIAQAIRNTRDLFSRPAHGQSPHLLEKPLLSVLSSPATATPLAIIVDGLDECTDTGGQVEIINAMVQLAASIRARGNQCVKVFIGSRPEYEIQSRFDALASDSNITIVRLDDSDANIHLFYDQQLDKIRKKFSLPPSWPSKAEIKWLMEKTSGQYSFADVSTRLMYDGDPIGRLKLIRDGVTGQDDKLDPFEALDQLYATVLKQVSEDMLLPALRVLRCRLHPDWDRSWTDLLEPLLQLRPGQIQTLRPYLSSLIDFDNELRPYHASLADFLIDRGRSGKFSLYIDDRFLSHTIQEGALTIFGEQDESKRLDEDGKCAFDSFIQEDGWISSLVIAHPLPSTRLAFALKKIDPSSLPIELSTTLLIFLELLQRQRRSLHFRALHPVLWYTIRYALPQGIRAEWERRTMVYSSVDKTHLDTLFGFKLALYFRSLSGRFSWVRRSQVPLRDQGPRDRLLTNIAQWFPQCLDRDMVSIDSSQGWNLFGSESDADVMLCRRAFIHHLRTSLTAHSWRYVQATLLLVSKGPTLEHARQVLFSLVHWNHTNYSPSGLGTIQLSPDSLSCDSCAGTFDQIVRDLLDGINEVMARNIFPVQPREIVATYHILRGSEICWGDRRVVYALMRYTVRCLELPRFQYLPAFLTRSQRVELERILADLVCRHNELYGVEDKISDIAKLRHIPLLQFIVSQLRLYDDLVLFVFCICSLIVCFFAVYIML